MAVDLSAALQFLENLQRQRLARQDQGLNAIGAGINQGAGSIAGALMQQAQNERIAQLNEQNNQAAALRAELDRRQRANAAAETNRLKEQELALRRTQTKESARTKREANALKSFENANKPPMTPAESARIAIARKKLADSEKAAEAKNKREERRLGLSIRDFAFRVRKAAAQSKDANLALQAKTMTTALIQSSQKAASLRSALTKAQKLLADAKLVDPANAPAIQAQIDQIKSQLAQEESKRTGFLNQLVTRFGNLGVSFAPPPAIAVTATQGAGPQDPVGPAINDIFGENSK